MGHIWFVKNEDVVIVLISGYAHIDEKVKSFYRCANGILRIDGRSSETVMLQLLETHCLSILTYAIEVTHVANCDERRRLRVAYNSLFCRVFNYRNWESVTDLQHALHRPTWEELIEKRQRVFYERISQVEIFSMYHLKSLIISSVWSLYNCPFVFAIFVLLHVLLM